MKEVQIHCDIKEKSTHRYYCLERWMINKNSDKILKNKGSIIDEIEMIEIKFTVK